VSHQFKFCVAFGSGGRLRFATRTGPGTFDIQDIEAGGAWPQLVFDNDGVARLAHVAGGTLRYGVARAGDDQ
jgi:hypothetical protein